MGENTQMNVYTRVRPDSHTFVCITNGMTVCTIRRVEDSAVHYGLGQRFYHIEFGSHLFAYMACCSDDAKSSTLYEMPDVCVQKKSNRELAPEAIWAFKPLAVEGHDKHGIPYSSYEGVCVRPFFSRNSESWPPLVGTNEPDINQYPLTVIVRDDDYDDGDGDDESEGIHYMNKVSERVTSFLTCTAPTVIQDTLPEFMSTVYCDGRRLCDCVRDYTELGWSIINSKQ